MHEPMIWQDIRHYAVLDIQKYTIAQHILTVETGLLRKHSVSVPLYRITATRQRRTLIQRILGLCTITLSVKDDATNTLTLSNIRYEGGTIYYTLVREIDLIYRALLLAHHSAIHDAGISRYGNLVGAGLSWEPMG